MSGSEREYLTVAEAAERYGVTARCVRKWLRQGKLGGCLVGRQWVVHVEGDDSSCLSPEGAVGDNGPGEHPIPQEMPPAPGHEPGHGRLPPVPKPDKGGQGAGIGRRFHAQSLKVWEIASTHLRPLLSDLDSDDPLRRELARRSLLVFEELCRGYHAFHYRDKVGHYLGARDELCSVAAIAALAGDDGLSREIQDRLLQSLAALIRSMERKGKNRDGA